MNERRRKLVPVSSIFMHDQLWAADTFMHVKCVDGLPKDATFISLTYDFIRDAYYFCYQSAEWNEVPDGMMLPVFYPTFMKLEVAPFLEQAELLLTIQFDTASSPNPDIAQWLKEYRAFKKQTGYPNHTIPPSIDPDNALAEEQKGEFTETEPW